MSLQHVVLFSFPAQLTAEEEREFIAIVKRWPVEVATMRNLRLGRDLAIVGDRSQGYQYLLYMEFDDIDTFVAYRAHPAHVALSEFIKPRDCNVLAFDYELSAAGLLA